MSKKIFVLVTCEHGGNEVPAEYQGYFQDRQALLDSHRGYDAGALDVARDLAQALQAPLVTATTTRLLVDLNRSPGHPRLFSEATRDAPREVREAILDAHYRPYREQVEEQVRTLCQDGAQVVHLSSHSFTPELDDVTRNADVGLLYDPRRPDEAHFAALWRLRLLAHLPTLRVRRNYPYRGQADGLTVHLRRRFAPERYVGVELEVNQIHCTAGGGPWDALRRALAASVAETCIIFGSESEVHAGLAPAASFAAGRRSE